MTTTRTYDAAGRLTGVANSQGQTTLSSFEYTLNAVGNRTAVQSNIESAVFGYDSLHRLVTAEYAGGGSRRTPGADGNTAQGSLASFTFGRRPGQAPASLLSTTIASDNFESGNLSGGSGWSGNWSVSSSYAGVVSSGGPIGSYHLRTYNTGWAQRTVDLASATAPTLTFSAKRNSYFSGSHQAYVDVSTNGTSWTTLRTLTQSDLSTSSYQAFEVDLSAYAGQSALRVRFRAATSSLGYFYVDNVQITAPDPTPTPTPTATATPTPTATATSTATPTPTATPTATFTPSPTYTPTPPPGGGGPPPQSYAYTYDAVGNRLSMNSTAYAYDDADQMTSAGGVSYAYDANGNQTARGSDTFVWDHENRLVAATIGGVTTTYACNGDGLRLSKATAGVTTSYTWDVVRGIPVIVQETTGAATRSFAYGRRLVSTTDGAGGQTYRLTDGLGSTVQLVDGAGSLLVTYAYDAFGNVRSQSAGHANEWLFAGEQRDQESGYDYLRARYYDPGTGRFSLDPLGGGYPYAANNPVRFVDPTGLYQICGDDEVWGWICFDSIQVYLSPCDMVGNCYIWTPNGTISLPGEPDWCNANECFWWDWPPLGHISKITLGEYGPAYGLLTCNDGGTTVTCYVMGAGDEPSCCLYFRGADRRLGCGFTQSCRPEDWNLPSWKDAYRYLPPYPACEHLLEHEAGLGGCNYVPW